MDDKVKGAGRKGKIADIAGVQNQIRPPGQMRHFGGERLGIARQHHRRSFQAKLVTGPRKTFQQPAAKKTRAAGDENPPATQFFPESRRVRQDVIEVGRQWIHFKN